VIFNHGVKICLLLDVVLCQRVVVFMPLHKLLRPVCLLRPLHKLRGQLAEGYRFDSFSLFGLLDIEFEDGFCLHLLVPAVMFLALLLFLLVPFLSYGYLR